MRRLKLSTLNVGNLLVVVGLGTLAVGFWLPYATAARVHRIEDRAGRTVREIFRVAEALPAIAWADPSAHAALVQAANAGLGRTDPDSSIYLHARAASTQFRGQSWWLEDKHYLFLITETPITYLDTEDEIRGPGDDKSSPTVPVMPGDRLAPPPKPLERESTGAPPHHNAPHHNAPKRQPGQRAMEVYAWPKGSINGAQTVFFCGTGASPAFHRNLAERYFRAESPPQPGDGYFHHFHHPGAPEPRIYYGYDDERWQVIRQPEGGNG